MHLTVVFVGGVEIVARMAPEAPPVLHLTAAHHRLRSPRCNTKVRHTSWLCRFENFNSQTSA
jgi:hypothetical protein